MLASSARVATSGPNVSSRYTTSAAIMTCGGPPMASHAARPSAFTPQDSWHAVMDLESPLARMLRLANAQARGSPSVRATRTRGPSSSYFFSSFYFESQDFSACGPNSLFNFCCKLQCPCAPHVAGSRPGLIHTRNPKHPNQTLYLSICILTSNLLIPFLLLVPLVPLHFLLVHFRLIGNVGPQSFDLFRDKTHRFVKHSFQPFVRTDDVKGHHDERRHQ